MSFRRNFVCGGIVVLTLASGTALAAGRTGAGE
jgi:hypothetical protein